MKNAMLAEAQERWLTAEFWRTATVEDVRAALAGGADVNARDEKNRTPLHFAAGLSAVPGVVKALLAAGADVDARAELGWTPLHYAALWSAAPGVVKALVAGGADVDARDDDGDTPLFVTVWNNAPGVKEVLEQAEREARGGARGA